MSAVRIETERLLLRPPEAGDFEAYATYMADAEAMRFLDGALARPAAWRAFLVLVGAWRVQGFSMFSVIEKSSMRWIGRIGPWFPEGWPGAEIGWGLVRDVWGKGYAYEGSVAAINWAFEHLRWDEIIHCIHPQHTDSQALARRLGSTCRGRGRLPAPYQDRPTEIWSQRREQWLAQSH